MKKFWTFFSLGAQGVSPDPPTPPPPLATVLTNIFEIWLINELWYLMVVWGIATNINVNSY